MSIDLEQVDLRSLGAEIETEHGSMKLRFFAEKAPLTVRNFCKLAQEGYYDGLTFHRIVKDFMIQGGCPEGTGTGGPGYTIPAEFNDAPHDRGVLSMARKADPDSAGSQFFIVHAPSVPSLDGKYTAFGKLVEGYETLDSLASVETTFGPGGERSKPVEPVEIKSVKIFVWEEGESEGEGSTEESPEGTGSPEENVE
ncbi:MAG TPA: peptidylprolyl isomerase [Planctomycetes bacterium]|nr:peptidylprolyl isomerase [Planctomycetota bacterium]